MRRTAHIVIHNFAPERHIGNRHIGIPAEMTVFRRHLFIKVSTPAWE